jgi:hypothetical protein
MAASDPLEPIVAAPQSSGRKALPDLRLLHYNDVYHIEYVRSSRELAGGSLSILSGQAQRSPLAASLASKLLSRNIEMTFVMPTSPPFSRYSPAMHLTPALKALSQRAGIWFRF